MTTAKAIIGGILAALLAGAGSLATVLVGNTTLSDVTQGQWLAAGIVTLTALLSVFGGVYAVTNAPAKITAEQRAQVLDEATTPVGASSTLHTLPKKGHFGYVDPSTTAVAEAAPSAVVPPQVGSPVVPE